ncbi:hypothetical protein ACJX0J_000588, partial [Zea mays]
EMTYKSVRGISISVTMYYAIGMPDAMQVTFQYDLNKKKYKVLWHKLPHRRLLEVYSHTNSHFLQGAHIIASDRLHQGFFYFFFVMYLTTLIKAMEEAGNDRAYAMIAHKRMSLCISFGFTIISTHLPWYYKNVADKKLMMQLIPKYIHAALINIVNFECAQDKQVMLVNESFFVRYMLQAWHELHVQFIIGEDMHQWNMTRMGVAVLQRD